MDVLPHSSDDTLSKFQPRISEFSGMDFWSPSTSVHGILAPGLILFYPPPPSDWKSIASCDASTCLVGVDERSWGTRRVNWRERWLANRSIRWRNCWNALTDFRTKSPASRRRWIRYLTASPYALLEIFSLIHSVFDSMFNFSRKSISTFQHRICCRHLDDILQNVINFFILLPFLWDHLCHL